MIRLAIVIVSFNTRRHLQACLQSLHAAPPHLAHTIVVVDNGSSDGSAAAVRAAWPDVQVIEMGRNAGFAAATNAGIRACDSDLVLLLNSDTLVPPDSIDRLAAALDRDAAAAAAGPRLVDRTGRVELSFGRMLSPWNEARQKLIALGISAAIPPIIRWFDRRVTAPHHPDWVSGACLLARRDAGAAAGWLDERFFLYGEDVDFCAALRGAGHRILFTPEAEIVHLRGQSRASDRVAADAAYRRSQIAFYVKHHPWWAGILRLYLRARGQLPPPSI